MSFLNRFRRSSARWNDKLRKSGSDNRGVAAVEFALILPLMLVLYIGTAELTTGLMANRKMTVVARALSDLVAQETDETNGITDATLDSIFGAANAILHPFDTTKLKMTVSSVEFVPDASNPPVYTAKTVWSAVRNGGTFRPCGTLTKVANTADPTPSTMPSGLYQAGTIIVADVEYDYKPTFGGAFLAWSSTDSSIPMDHTTYMKPRTQNEIKYNPPSPPSSSTICP